MRAYIIDPFQRDVHEVEIAHDLHAWYQAIDADCLDVVSVGWLANGHRIDVWVDDEGLIKDQPYPCFQLANRRLCGFGLVLECDASGESQGVTFPMMWFQDNGLRFEGWEKRLDARNYFDQLTKYLKEKPTGHLVINKRPNQ